MIVDMLHRERLPWHDQEERNEVEARKRRMMAHPEEVFDEAVSHGSGLNAGDEISIPPHFQRRELREVCAYLTRQHYVDRLDYDWMRTMCQRVAVRLQCQLEPPYDWNNERSTRTR
jgi:hypothetical protein